MMYSFRSCLSLLSLALVIGGCSMDPGATGVHSQSGSLDSVPEDDDNLQFVKQHGFGGIVFVNDCVSVGDDGSVVQGDPLPVGGGRHLECTTALRVDTGTTGLQSMADEPWCALGHLVSHNLTGDSRLTLSVASAPEDGPWSLIATAAEPIEIHSVGAFGGLTWPLTVNATYETTDMQPEVPGQRCDEMYGL
jgi:hypothetical protein